MILLVDNYDSFVFNLERYLLRLGQATEVVRSDEVQLDRIAAGYYSAIVISPGPKAPQDAGQSLPIIERFHSRVPILGVCLGHQAICQAFGARIVRANRAVHGKSSLIRWQESRLFSGLPNPFRAARYHSLVASPDNFPASLRITATCSLLDDSEQDARPEHSFSPAPDDSASIIMAVEHREWPVFGVQFHPESILSDVGYSILANFLKLAGLTIGGALPTADFARPEVWSNFELQTQRRPDDWPPVVLPRGSDSD